MGKGTAGLVLPRQMTVRLPGCLSQQDQPLLPSVLGAGGGAGGGGGIFLPLGSKRLAGLFPSLKVWKGPSGQSNEVTWWLPCPSGNFGVSQSPVPPQKPRLGISWLWMRGKFKCIERKF